MDSEHAVRQFQVSKLEYASSRGGVDNLGGRRKIDLLHS